MVLICKSAVAVALICKSVVAVVLICKSTVAVVLVCKSAVAVVLIRIPINVIGHFELPCNNTAVTRRNVTTLSPCPYTVGLGAPRLKYITFFNLRVV